jgi:hypothetical protein
LGVQQTPQSVPCTVDGRLRANIQAVAVLVANGNQTYLVKWLDREIRFAQKPASTCSTAGLTTSSVALPDAKGLQDPSDPSSPAYNGVEPQPTNMAPRVIQGQVMY